MYYACILHLICVVKAVVHEACDQRCLSHCNKHSRTNVACVTKNMHQLACGPMPNVMVALLNIGGALCSMSQSLAGAHYLTAAQ